MDNPTKILSDSIDERWKFYRTQLKTCRREISEEAVHDLRVATRRLLAVMEILHILDPHPRVQKVRKALKGQLDALDGLRDIQVMLVETAKRVETLPQLKPFIDTLHEREKALRRAARKQIKATQPSELKKRINKIKLMLEKSSFNDDFNERLLRVVDQAYLNAAQAYGQLDASQPATLHRLRIAFKKFRYMVEIIHPILAEYPQTYFKRMHDYQSMLGDIQDVEIFLGILTDVVETGVSSFEAEPVRKFYEHRRTDLITAYLDNKKGLNIFWRNPPDQPFPWEK